MNSQTLIFRFDIMLNDWPFWTHQCRSENKMFVHWILINLKVKIFIDPDVWFSQVRLGWNLVEISITFCLVWPLQILFNKEHNAERLVSAISCQNRFYTIWLCRNRQGRARPGLGYRAAAGRPADRSIAEQTDRTRSAAVSSLVLSLLQMNTYFR